MTITRRDFLGVAGVGALALFAPRDEPRPVARADVPAAGTRWAMIVDIRKCQELKGCTRCIAACHAVHNVPSIGERRHEVKWVWKEPYEAAFPTAQHPYTEDALKGKMLPVLCNHCDNPPCTRVCPTKATWKREDGIVMMDWHRCIGCRYCIAACPYGSRSFNWLDPRPHIAAITPDYPTRTKGVVEKCTFCEERLANGQQPACVEACPNSGLVFGNLADERSEVRRLLRARHALQRKPELGTGPAVFYVID